eukprot:jgi/Bigna1/135279/aug1.28_g9987
MASLFCRRQASRCRLSLRLLHSASPRRQTDAKSSVECVSSTEASSLATYDANGSEIFKAQNKALSPEPNVNDHLKQHVENLREIEVLKNHIRSRDLKSIEQVYDRMKQGGDVQLEDSTIYNEIIEICIMEGNLLKAEIWLNRMAAAGKTPDQDTFRLAINACTRSNSFEDAHRWVEIMAEMGVHPDATTSLSIVEAIFKSGAFSQVRDWVLSMDKMNTPISVDIYALALDACAREGDINQMADWMKKMNGKGIKPTKCMYRSMLQAYSRAHMVEQAERVIKSMEEAEIKPNANAYAQLISCCCATGEVRVALKWLTNAIHNNSVDSDCFEGLIAYYGKPKASEHVIKILNLMDAAGVQPRHRDFYMTTFKALSASGARSDHIIEWLCKMHDQEHFFDLRSCNEVMSTLIEHGDVDTARSVLENVAQKLFNPDQVTCQIMLSGLEKSSPEKAVSFLLNMLLSLGVAPNVAHYNSGLRACSRFGDTRTVRGLIGLMTESLLEPNASTFEIAIRTHAYHGDLKGAKEWLEAAQEAGFGNSRIILNAMLEVQLSTAASNEEVMGEEEEAHSQRRKRAAAYRALEWVKELHGSSSSALGLWPLDANGTSTLIRSLLEANLESAALECFEAFLSDMKEATSRTIQGGEGEQWTRELQSAEWLVVQQESQPVYEAFIWHYSASEDEKKVSEWLDKALSSRVELQSRWFAMAIMVHIKKANIQTARNRFRQMHELGVKRDACVYDLMASIGLGTSMAQQQQQQQHQQLQQQISENNSSNYSQEEQLLALMKEDRIPPSVHTFSRMLGLAAKCSRQGRRTSPGSVNRIMKLMNQENVAPNEECKRFALEAMSRSSKGQHDEKMRKQLIDSVVSLEPLVHDHLNNNQIDKALKLFLELIKEVEEGGKEPSAVLKSRMLHSLVKHNKRSIAEKIFYLLPNPSPYDFTAMAQQYAREGNLSRVKELLNYVFGSNIDEMDLECYHTVIQACAESDPSDHKTAKRLMKYLKAKNVPGKDITKRRIKFYLTLLFKNEAQQVFPEVELEFTQNSRPLYPHDLPRLDAR